MKQPKDKQKFGALVPTGQRIDHPEDVAARQQRELNAAFNRMNSDSEAEAYNAFDKARRIMHEIGMNFDTLLKNAKEAADLSKANTDLGKQLQAVMRENAKYRAMNISYKIKGRLVQSMRGFGKLAFYGAPLLVIAVLFQLGYAAAGGAALLVVLVGLYHIVRGFIIGYGTRTLIGVAILLAGVVGISIVSDRDAPYVHKQRAALVENMNRDHELGPRTFYIDYPISRTTMVTTIYGIKDVLNVTIEGAAAPLEVSCAKYYEKSVTAPRGTAARMMAPDKPDIFHSIPVATFGQCDLYAKLAGLR